MQMNTNTKGYWATNGVAIEMDEIDKLLYKNDSIEIFLREHSDQFFVIAEKGIGKTLLLKKKKYDLMQKPGGLFIPSKENDLDFADDFINIPRDTIRYLENYENVKSLWNISIQLSAVNRFLLCNDKISVDKSELPDIFLKILEGKAFSMPSVIFTYLIRTESISKIQQFINKSFTYINYLYRQIQSAVYIFIDRLDQALQSNKFCSAKMWTAMQVSLIEVSWNLMEKNSHVKIYCSIRKEAYSDYKAEVRGNLAGQVCMLNYSDSDLHKLINTLSNYYEDGNTIEQIVGFDKFEHPKTGNDEILFHYLLRHTVSKPRGLVRIASELRKSIPLDKTINEKADILRTVTNMAATTIVEELFSEQGLFLSCLQDETDRNRFFSLIPKNTLNQQTVYNICKKFNNKKSKCSEKQCKENGKCKHPFCDLYNIGLFGYVSTDSPYIQKFKSPDSTKRINHIPSSSHHYIIHPALCDIIKDLTRDYEGTNYIVTPGITTGKGKEWNIRENKISDFIDFILNAKISKEKKKEMIQRARENIKEKNEESTLDRYIENEKQAIISMKKLQPKQKENEIHILIASPSDVQTRDKLLKEFETYFGKDQEKLCGKRVFVHGYEELASGLEKGNVQDKINEKIKKDIDIVIAIFKHKLGSPISNLKGKQRVESGTVDELLKYKENKTYPMAYFCSGSPTENLDDLKVIEDWQKVLMFKRKLESKKNGNVIFFKHYSKDEKEHIFPLLAEDLKNNIIELFK